MKCPRCKSHVTFYPAPDTSEDQTQIGFCDNMECDYQTKPFEQPKKIQDLREYIKP